MDTICTDGEFQRKTEGYVIWGTFSAAAEKSGSHDRRRSLKGLSIDEAH
jgi:hypothetical protein